LAEFFAESSSEEEIRPMLPLLRVAGLDAGLSLQLCAWVSRGTAGLRTELLSLLEEMGDPAGGPALRLALFDDDGDTAALAARVIGKIRFSAGVPVLLKAIKVRQERFPDEEAFLVAACRTFGELADERAIPFLEESAKHHLLLRGRNRPAAVRLSAIEALAHIDRPKVWEFLETLAEEKNGAIQEILERVARERTGSLAP
jgi:HEAT repeat protein